MLVSISPRYALSRKNHASVPEIRNVTAKNLFEEIARSFVKNPNFIRATQN